MRRRTSRAAAQGTGVGRIVYLGGLVPQPAPVSETLQPPSPSISPAGWRSNASCSRAVPDSVALRASIVIGARSRSFRFLVRLVERLPLLLIPAWREHSTAPVDERDVTQCLARRRPRQPRSPAARSTWPGPDTVTYGELIERIRDHLMLPRPTVTLSRLTLTPIASRVSAVIAGEQHALIGPLMEGLDTDLLPRAELATELLRVVSTRSTRRSNERCVTGS